MQCEREIGNFQAQPRAVFQRMRGKAAKGAVPTEIRVLVVRLRRDIGPRGSREPLYRMMSLQAGLAQPALVHAAKWHPIRTTHAHPTHGSLPFPLSCPIEIDDDLAQAHFGNLLLWVMCGQRGRSENDSLLESLLGRRSSHRGDETGRTNDLFPDRIP